MSDWLIERLPHLKQLQVYLPFTASHTAAASAAAAKNSKPPIQISGDRLLYAPPEPDPLARIDLKPLLVGAGNTAPSVSGSGASGGGATGTGTGQSAPPAIASGSDHHLVKIPLPQNFVITDETDDFPTADELDIKRMRVLCCRDCGLPLTAPVPVPVPGAAGTDQALSTRLSPNRILPLPSPYWQELVDLWYCHNAEASALRSTELAGIHPPPVSPLVTVTLTTPTPLADGGASDKAMQMDGPTASAPPAAATEQKQKQKADTNRMDESDDTARSANPPPAVDPLQQKVWSEAAAPESDRSAKSTKPKSNTGAGYGPPPGTVRTVTRGGVVYYVGTSHVLLHASAIERSAVVYEPFAAADPERRRMRWGISPADDHSKHSHSHAHGHSHGHSHSHSHAKLVHDLKSGGITGKTSNTSGGGGAAANNSKSSSSDGDNKAPAPDAVMRVLCSRCSAVIGEADVVMRMSAPVAAVAGATTTNGAAASPYAFIAAAQAPEPEPTDVRLFKYKLTTCNRHILSTSSTAKAAAEAASAFDALSFGAANSKPQPTAVANGSGSGSGGGSMVVATAKPNPEFCHAAPCECPFARNAFRLYTAENAIASDVLAYAQAHACFRFVIADEEQTDLDDTEDGSGTGAESGYESGGGGGGGSIEIDDGSARHGKTTHVGTTDRKRYILLVLTNWDTAIKTGSIPSATGSVGVGQSLAMAPIIKLLFKETENTRYVLMLTGCGVVCTVSHTLLCDVI